MSAPGPIPSPRPPSGSIAWASGLGVLVCVPFLSSVVACVVMAVVGRNQRGKGALAAENGRNAANWALTYLVLTVVLVGAHFGLLYALTADGGTIEGFFPFGLIICSWIALTLAHLVISIVGVVRASRGRVLRVPAVPFFTAR